MAWMYKVCKIHLNRKTYTVVGYYYEKFSARNAQRNFAFFDRSHKYIVKRYSEKEGIF